MNISYIAQKQLLSLYNVIIDELVRGQKLNIKSKLKNIRIALLNGQNPFKSKKYFWPNALLAQSLEYFFIFNKDYKTIEALEYYYSRWIKSGAKVDYIDQATHGYVLAFLYEQTNKEIYKKILDSIYNFLRSQPKTPSGGLFYRKGNNGTVLVDGVGMTCPFLTRYGVLFENKDAIKMALDQIISYLEHGLDNRSKLPYHGYNENYGINVGIIGWGRGVGWLLIGLVDTLERISHTDSLYEYIKTKFIEITDTVIDFQKADGSFSWLLEATSGESDSSATSMIAYSIQKAIWLGIIDDKYLTYTKKAFKSINNLIDEGRVQGCSGECIGIGLYPQVFGNYPWTQGPSTAFIALLAVHEKTLSQSGNEKGVYVEIK